MIKSKLEKRFQNLLLFYHLTPPSRGCDKMYGRPDFVLKTKKVVIFIDGSFFHTNHKNHCKIDKKSNLLQNIHSQLIRDQEVNRFYKKRGWKILRISEEDLFDCPESVINSYKLIV